MLAWSAHAMGWGPCGRIERVTPAELMFLALQASTVPEQFGAVLVLEPRGTFDVRSAIQALDERVRSRGSASGS
jgi:hypothetical protein